MSRFRQSLLAACGGTAHPPNQTNNAATQTDRQTANQRSCPKHRSRRSAESRERSSPLRKARNAAGRRPFGTIWRGEHLPQRSLIDTLTLTARRFGTLHDAHWRGVAHRWSATLRRVPAAAIANANLRPPSDHRRPGAGLIRAHPGRHALACSFEPLMTLYPDRQPLPPTKLPRQGRRRGGHKLYRRNTATAVRGVTDLRKTYRHPRASARPAAAGAWEVTSPDIDLFDRRSPPS